jgi:hypothetical protein
MAPALINDAECRLTRSWVIKRASSIVLAGGQILECATVNRHQDSASVFVCSAFGGLNDSRRPKPAYDFLKAGADSGCQESITVRRHRLRQNHKQVEPIHFNP